MKKIRGKSQEKNASTAKITVWYVFSSVFVNALSFLTTPIFTRLLSKAEYGQYSNFVSWLTILEVIVTLNVSMSITRAKYEFDKEMEKYISSLLLFSNIVTIGVYGVVEMNKAFFVDFFSMDIFLIRIMFVYLLFHPAFVYLQIKHRIYQKYKFFVAFSITTSLLRTITALILVCNCNNGVYARVLGDIVPFTMFNIVLWTIILFKGKGMYMRHILFAVSISIALIPHTLAGQLLSHADKIMITSYCGSEYNAVYSLVYSVGALASVIWSAMNQAWTPWLYDHMAIKADESIREKSKIYLMTFSIIIVGVLLMAPEAVLILGGKKYYQARFILPIIIMSCVCQFIYGMYVNIEIFTKKTFQISVGTISAGLVNIGLNILFIPQYGYVAAAWTTLVSYALLLVFHYYMVRRGGEYTDIYDVKFILGILAGLSLLSLSSALLYVYNAIRYIFVLTYVILLLVFFVRNKSNIRSLMR